MYRIAWAVVAAACCGGGCARYVEPVGPDVSTVEVATVYADAGPTGTGEWAGASVRTYEFAITAVDGKSIRAPGPQVAVAAGPHVITCMASSPWNRREDVEVKVKYRFAAGSAYRISVEYPFSFLDAVQASAVPPPGGPNEIRAWVRPVVRE